MLLRMRTQELSLIVSTLPLPRRHIPASRGSRSPVKNECRDRKGSGEAAAVALIPRAQFITGSTLIGDA